MKCDVPTTATEEVVAVPHPSLGKVDGMAHSLIEVEHGSFDDSGVHTLAAASLRRSRAPSARSHKGPSTTAPAAQASRTPKIKTVSHLAPAGKAPAKSPGKSPKVCCAIWFGAFQMVVG